MKQAAGNPVHAVVSLADQQLRTEQAEKPPKAEKAEKPEKPKKAEKPDPGKKSAMVEKGQVSVWDLINEKQPFSAE